MGAALAAFWEERSARERMVLLGGAGLLLAIALYVLLWEPGLAARRSLAAALPRLRAELQDMRAQREEILALRKELSAGSRRGDLQSLLRASTARTGFAAAVERLDPVENGGALLHLGSVSFHAWLEWIEGLQRELGVRIAVVKVVALEQPGLVRVEARFAPLAAAPGTGAP